ncbi:MAG: cation diffusion facilitator family transporter [Candidatus Woesearchaeota archaeon]
MDKLQVSIAGIGANLFLFLIKIVVGVISGSYGILADAVNSGSDIFASFMNYMGIRLSNKPSDEKHPYGHYKYEVLFGLFVTLIIFGSALYIIYKAILGIITPEALEFSILGIIVMLISAATNEIMSRLKITTGKRENSLSLVADGVHSRIDVLTSAGVLVGLLLSNVWIYADAIVALLVGIYILKEAYELAREATENLVDVAADKEQVDKVREVLKNEGLKSTELKTQKRGSKFTANLTISLPKDMTVDKATKQMNYLRQKLIDQVPELTYVTISMEDTETQTSYYRGPFGRGYGWQTKNTEYCVCPKCGHKVKHDRGVPCKTKKCPHCDEYMVRENAPSA